MNRPRRQEDRLHLRVSADLAGRLARAADREGEALSVIVRRELVGYLARVEPVEPRPSPFTSRPELSGDGTGGSLGNGLTAFDGMLSGRAPGSPEDVS